MSKMTLAELRESPHVKPLERSISICVAGDLVAEYEELDNAYLAAPEEPRNADGEGPSNRRAAEGPSERLQIAQRMELLREKMLRHEVSVRLRRDRVKWRAYKNEHPPRVVDGRHAAFCPAERADGDEANQRECDGCLPNRDDAIHGVNVDDLAEDVGDWVVGLNGEPVGRAVFDEIVGGPASDGDLRDAARTVAGMHEGKSLIPKSRLELHETLTRDDDSPPPGRSE